MKDRKLALRYARALMSALDDLHRAESADRFLSTLATAMKEDGAFRQFMLDPAVTRDDRTRALRALAEAASQPTEVANFVETIVRNNRTAAIPAIATVFREVREDAAGIVPAEIVTAQPMGHDDERRAGAAIEKLTGRTVRLSTRVDPTLLGGAVTRIGSTVYDGSLRTQLDSLRRRMVQE